MRSPGKALVIAGIALGVALAPAFAQSATDPGQPPTGYDRVGYAAASSEATAGHATLPPDSVVEVTALDTGHTVLVRIGRTARTGQEIELPAAVAQDLGLAPGKSAAVRVRAAGATPTDLAALGSRATVPRPDAPPALLTALRRKLTGEPAPLAAAVTRPSPAASPGFAAVDIVASRPSGPAAAVATARPSLTVTPKPISVRPAPSRTPAPQRPAPPPQRPAPGAVTGARYYVQIAALSDARRAAALASSTGGRVTTGGAVHRVRLGPFTDLKFAQAARDAVARRGYGDARIVRD